jgi:hypothetical protein
MSRKTKTVRCNGCDLPIRDSKDLEWCSDGTPYHRICFDIIASSMQAQISNEVKRMRKEGKWHGKLIS